MQRKAVSKEYEELVEKIPILSLIECWDATEQQGDALSTSHCGHNLAECIVEIWVFDTASERVKCATERTLF